MSVRLSGSMSVRLSAHPSFFLEKNMQSFFLKILSQRCGQYVSIQLLQTLNILFENIKNETSICECYLAQGGKEEGGRGGGADVGGKWCEGGW